MRGVRLFIPIFHSIDVALPCSSSFSFPFSFPFPLLLLFPSLFPLLFVIVLLICIPMSALSSAALLDSLECHVCCEAFQVHPSSSSSPDDIRLPHIFPCGHSICRACVTRFLQQGLRACDRCATPLRADVQNCKDVPLNYELIAALTALHKQTSVAASSPAATAAAAAAAAIVVPCMGDSMSASEAHCTSPATLYCVQCEMYFCTFHQNSHHLSGHAQQSSQQQQQQPQPQPHQAMTISERMRQETAQKRQARLGFQSQSQSQSQSQPSTCSLHYKPLELYCTMCQCTCCVECSASAIHQTHVHNVINILQHTKRTQQAMYKHLQILQQLDQIIEKEMKESEFYQHKLLDANDKFLLDIEAFEQRVMQVFKQKVQSIKTETITQIQKASVSYANYHTGLRSTRASLATQLADCERDQQISECALLLPVEAQHQQMVEHLKSSVHTKLHRRPLYKDGITYELDAPAHALMQIIDNLQAVTFTQPSIFKLNNQFHAPPEPTEEYKQNLQQLRHQLEELLNNFQEDDSTWTSQVKKNFSSTMQLQLDHDQSYSIALFDEKLYLDVRAFAKLVSCFDSVPQLQHLDLRDVDLGADGAKYLGACLKQLPRLMHLDLRSNGLGVEGAKYVSEALQHAPHLLHLDLSGNSLGAEGVTYVAQGLQWVPQLQILDLCYSNIGVGVGISAGVECVRTLADSLKYVPQLRVFSFYGNHLGVKGGRYISEGMHHVPLLQQLALQDNELSAEGGRYIGESLKKLQRLQELHIHSNNLGSQGTKYILDQLNHLPHLQELFISDNQMGAENENYLKNYAKSKALKTDLDLS